MEIDINKRSQYNVIFRYTRSGKSRLNRKKSDPVESEHVQVPCARSAFDANSDAPIFFLLNCKLP